MRIAGLRPRAVYAAVFLLLVVAEVLIALFVRDTFIRPYGGDIIVMGVLYCFIRIFSPKGIGWLPAALFGFAVFVEAAQAVDYARLLGLGEYEFFRILLGSSFSWVDIACYAAGGLICFVVQLLTVKKDAV